MLDTGVVKQRCSRATWYVIEPLQNAKGSRTSSLMLVVEMLLMLRRDACISSTCEKKKMKRYIPRVDYSGLASSASRSRASSNSLRISGSMP